MSHQYEPGNYWMQTPTIGLGVSGKNNSPYIYLEGNIVWKQDGVKEDGTDNCVEVPHETRTVFLYITDAAFPHTADKLDALGWNGDFSKPGLVGNAAQGLWVECSHETFQNKLREKWNLPGGGFEHKAPSSDVIRKANALYKARKGAAAKPAPVAATRPATAPAAPAPTPGDDVF